jgi:hypothetical protein
MSLRRLRTYRHWRQLKFKNTITNLLIEFPFSSDGTFKVVPKNFLQLYTLNVLVEQSSIVSAFVLMGNKAAATYIRVFENIRGHLNGIAPQSVMIDFEIGM